jgi:hypothetical protein
VCVVERGRGGVFLPLPPSGCGGQLPPSAGVRSGGFFFFSFSLSPLPASCPEVLGRV